MPPSFCQNHATLYGNAVWQPTPSDKRVDVLSNFTQPEPGHLHISLKVATYNGLALNDEDQSLALPGARSLRLDSQFHSKRMALVGIQEARTATGIRNTDHYKIYASGYQQCGKSKHYGCELWVSKFLPLARNQDGSSVKLSDCKVTITMSDPRLLVAKFEGPISFSVVVAHCTVCVSCKANRSGQTMVQDLAERLVTRQALMPSS